MAGDKRFSIKAALLTAIIAAATAFRDSAQAAVQAAKDADAAQAADLQKQLDDANKKLAEASAHLADFSDEEKVEDHPELQDAISGLLVSPAGGATADSAPAPGAGPGDGQPGA